MKHTTAEAVLEIRRREAILRARKGRLAVPLFSIAVIVLAGGVITGTALLSAGEPGRIFSAEHGYGAVLLAESMGGYVLAGMIAFIAGVAATIICLKHKDKRNRK